MMDPGNDGHEDAAPLWVVGLLLMLMFAAGVVFWYLGQ